MRTKNVVLTAEGFVTAFNLTLTAPEPLAAVFEMYGEPFVVAVRVVPVAQPLTVPSVALVVDKPVGITHAATLAVVQYSNFIDPILVPEGIVKLNWWPTTPLGLEPPSVPVATSVRLRAVICAAFAW